MMTGKIRLTRADSGKLLAANRNVVLYSAADILTRLVGGESEYTPNYIGFIYADKGYSGFPIVTNADRQLTWEDIVLAVQSAPGGNMIISPLLSGRDYKPSASPPYDGNIVTVGALTDRNSDPIFSFTTIKPTAGVHAYFMTVFMNRRFRTGQTVPTYTPYAYANINASGAGVEVIASAEYQQYWDVTIK